MEIQDYLTGLVMRGMFVSRGIFDLDELRFLVDTINDQENPAPVRRATAKTLAALARRPNKRLSVYDISSTEICEHILEPEKGCLKVCTFSVNSNRRPTVQAMALRCGVD